MAGRGSIKPKVGFNANADAEILYKAMKGFGTDETPILELLTARSNSQRQEIKIAFKSLYGEELVDELKSELRGKFEDLIVALFETPTMYDVKCLANAIQGMGTCEHVLINILGSRTCNEIKEITKTYKQEYDSCLEDHVSGDTDGAFKQMLIVLLQANRETGVKEAQVQSDAKALFEAGEKKKYGTDEEHFIKILGNRSYEHLRRVFGEYKQMSGFQIEESISRETSGCLQELLLAVVKCSRNIPAYLAETLHAALKPFPQGIGTDDATLIRVMVSRSEIDMLDIRAEFKKMYSTSLYKMIEGDVSGDYCKTLLLLCGGDDA